MSIDHSKLGPSLLNLCKRRAAANSTKLVPDTAFYYAELAALGTMLGRVVTSDSLGRAETSQQNYLLMFPKGVGKNSIVEASESRLQELLRRCSISERPIEFNETSTPESLAANLGYYRTFEPVAESKKVEADAAKQQTLLTQLDIDKEVEKRQRNWENDADSWLKSRRLTAIWYTREASTTLATLIGGARSQQEIGAKIGWALNAFDPFGNAESTRVTSGRRYVRHVCLSSLWTTQPKTFLSSFDLETLRFTGFFERMIPVVQCKLVDNKSHDEIQAENNDKLIELIHNLDRRVKVTFDKLPTDLDSLLDWELNLPAIQSCLSLDEEWTRESLSKWFGHARRIAHLRAFFEKVTENDLRNAQPIRADASDYLGEALEWVAEHYREQLRQELFSEVDSTFTRFIARLKTYLTSYYSADVEERDKVRELLYVNEDEGRAYFNRRMVMSNFSVKGLSYKQRSQLLEEWANSRDISLEDARPDKVKWNRKQPFIVVSLGRFRKGETK